jgi:DNA repair protein RecN (Recombination protein N)
MLRTLHIQNLALIERLELTLGPGLNVFTGETGAGKSILLDAFALVLGSRAETTMIRAGEDFARVEGLFEVGGHGGVRTFLEDHGLPVDDELVLARELNREARNRCWVNGSLTTRRVLEGLGDLLVDLHGQHDHQLLMRTNTHLSLVDDFGSEAHGRAVQEARQRVREYREVRSRLEQKAEDERARRVERDHLEFQIREIEEAELEAGEDDRLHDELRTLAGAEDIRADLAQALHYLAGDEDGDGAADLLARAAAAVRDAGSRTGSLEDLVEELERLSDAVGEARHEVERHAQVIQLDPERLREAEERMGLIHRLTRKYGPSCEAVLENLAGLRERLAELAGNEVRRDQDQRLLLQLETDLLERLPKLTRARRRLAKKLGAAIQDQIRDLAMPHAEVDIRIAGEDDPGGLRVGAGRVRLYADGLDRAEVLVATNPGEGPGPLAKVASGGELSRVMLGLKAAMARIEAVPIMVFDEIDAGVGGETGKVMAEKLAAVSAGCQCLCVTHLASIAAAGRRQFHVTKAVEGGRTRVAVDPVEGAARELEVARMLGAAEASEGLELARGLLGREPARKARGRSKKARRARS